MFHLNKITKPILLFWSLVLCFFSLAQTQNISLDEDWKFHLGNAANAEKDFNYSLQNVFVKSGIVKGTAIHPTFDDKDWKTVQIPHDWAVDLPFVQENNFDVASHGYKPVGGTSPETSIGWYRKKFRLQPADSGKKIELQFDGIYRNADVWVNGFYVGKNASGYVGVNYNISDFVNFAQDNVLVVRVDATQYEGWFYEGAGIYRHAWLNIYPSTHIIHHGIFAYSNIQSNKAEVTVETEINKESDAEDCIVVSQLINRLGQVVSTISTPLKQINSTVLKQKLIVPNPILWDVENPYLYRLVVKIQKNALLVDERVQRFGIRTIAIKPNGCFLNGKHIKIKGANNHQDHAGVGSALPDYLQYYRISLLKNMGCNAYRASHHAPTNELLDACDSLGMLVMPEQRSLNSSEAYLNELERLIKRDRSRACVFMWSIGNEEGHIQANDFGKRIATTLLKKIQALDPTRTCTYAADLPNVFKGVNEVIPVRGFNYRQTAVEAYNNEHPNQPIIGTEMGSTVSTRGELKTDSLKCYLPDQDISAPWWASRAEEWWPLAAKNDFWLGGFIWTGFDYRGEPTPFRWPNINSHFGVMDVCGFPKNIYYYYQSWWTDKDVLHISPHWNHINEWGKPAKIIDVWVNSNADSVELFLNKKSLGIKFMPKYGHLQWAVPFEAGKLQAVGYKKGRKIFNAIETTSQPVEVVVTPNKTTLVADGKDVTVINISVVDKEGREVPNANNKISFKIIGEAKIIGVGNGDPSCHEPDKSVNGFWERSLFNGKCQVLVQSTKQAGFIQFLASSGNLYDGSTDIITVSPQSFATVEIDSNYLLTNEQKTTSKFNNFIIGADISFLPELEAKGTKFIDDGKERDAIEILKEYGFNYIRLRLFNHPENSNGYSPREGFCNLEKTLNMAKRIKAAGLKWLLDFHYSDYWADPGKQHTPLAWQNKPFNEVKDSLYHFTLNVMQALAKQQTLPDIVQVGNEINHGMVWHWGSVQNFNGLAQLFNAGTAAVKKVAPQTSIMLHVALGGQNHESVFFIDNMLARNVHFDIIGQSYYPKWHSSLADLEDNLNDLAKRYNKDIIVVEYSALKKQVNNITYNILNNKGKGTFIWEPLNTWEKIIDDNGKTNYLLKFYKEINEQFNNKK